MDNINAEISRVKYPHMVREEIEIWKRFLRKYGSKYDRFRYDEHVGKGSGPIPGYSKKDQEMFIRLTQKRIDVVAFKRGAAFIVEIKPRAGLAAIGQLIAYKRLYQEKHGRFTVAGLAIVAESIDNDVRGVAENLGIQVVLV